MPDAANPRTDVTADTESEAGELLAAFRESHANAVFDPTRPIETGPEDTEPKQAESTVANTRPAERKRVERAEPTEDRGS
jgi:hypothetical protein